MPPFSLDIKSTKGGLKNDDGAFCFLIIEAESRFFFFKRRRKKNNKIYFVFLLRLLFNYL